MGYSQSVPDPGPGCRPCVAAVLRRVSDRTGCQTRNGHSLVAGHRAAYPRTRAWLIGLGRDPKQQNTSNKVNGESQVPDVEFNRNVVRDIVQYEWNLSYDTVRRLFDGAQVFFCDDAGIDTVPTVFRQRPASVLGSLGTRRGTAVIRRASRRRTSGAPAARPSRGLRTS